MSDRAQDGSELTERRPPVPGKPLGGRAGAARGPYDSGDAHPPDPSDALDFGPLRIRIPDEARLQDGNTAGTVARTVHLVVPTGQVDLSVLAAPRSTPLWPEIADEVAAVQGNGGAQVRSESGEWGQEVLAVSNDELSWFIGVDGPRWMLYGVATGPVAGSAELGATLREIIRGSVVRRGVEPLPVKTPLALTPPAQRRQPADDAGENSARLAPPEPVWFRLGPTPANAAVTPTPRLPPAPARPVALIGGTPAPRPERSEPARVGHWGLPTGVTVGAAGLILLVGITSVLVIERNDEQPAQTSRAALPEPTTAVADPPAGLPEPATALTNPPPDPAVAPVDPGPAAAGVDHPGSATAGSNPRSGAAPEIPTLIPRRRTPVVATPAGPAPNSAVAAPKEPAARLFERSRDAHTHAAGRGTARRPHSSPDSSDRMAWSADTPDDDDDNTTVPGLLGQLTDTLDQGWLGIG
jgi:Protein of unknown function (DUF3710)